MLLLCLATVCSGAPPQRPGEAGAARRAVSAESDAARRYSYQIIRAYPHDPMAYTQGLAYFRGFLYEGTGPFNGRSGPGSSIRKVDLRSGQVLQIRRLEDRVFGEGIAIFDNRLIQLTWKAGQGFVYDVDTFDRLSKLSYPGSGWGLTHDGSRLIMSDGSSTLYFRNQFTLEETGRVQVHSEGSPVVNLNELEFIDGEVYANVWGTDSIVRIDPRTGRVIAWIELGGLLSADDRGGRRVGVLNGIAYDAHNKRLFVTGKWWPKLYEITLVPKH